MAIQAKCKCGKQMTVEEDLAGQSVACMRCGRDVSIPEAQARASTTSSTATQAAAPAPPASVRDSLYWLLVVAFLPLAASPGRPEPTIDELIKSTTDDFWVQKHVHELLDEGDLDGAIAALPGGRMAGSYLPRHSYRHLLFAGLSAGLFGCVIAFCFAPGSANPLHLLATGAFTGTLGVCLLLAAHAIPMIGMFVDICVLSAEDPDSPFMTVFAGFTFGVGLVEELAKAVPLIWYWRRHRQMTWRMACLWGLASGVGFGVVEGITYSEQFYNGIFDGEMYLVRFASCVALHGIWTASVGIALVGNQELLLAAQQEAEERGKDAVHSWEQWGPLWGMVLLKVLLVPMFLHGLYDAALTRHLNWLALIAAGVSFGWLAWQIESCRREEQAEVGGLAPGSAAG